MSTQERILDYYPEVIKSIRDFAALAKAEATEVDYIATEIEAALQDSYLETMREARCEQWERQLGLPVATGSSLQDRRDNIMAQMRGSGKLSETAIQSIVKAYTGGTAKVHFDGTTLGVAIQPPSNNKSFQFPNVVAILTKRKPAHIALEVYRSYQSWEEVKTRYSTWGDMVSTDWMTVVYPD